MKNAGEQHPCLSCSGHGHTAPHCFPVTCLQTGGCRGLLGSLGGVWALGECLIHIVSGV